MSEVTAVIDRLEQELSNLIGRRTVVGPGDVPSMLEILVELQAVGAGQQRKLSQLADSPKYASFPASLGLWPIALGQNLFNGNKGEAKFPDRAKVSFNGLGRKARSVMISCDVAADYSLDAIPIISVEPRQLFYLRGEFDILTIKPSFPAAISVTFSTHSELCVEGNVQPPQRRYATITTKEAFQGVDWTAIGEGGLVTDEAYRNGRLGTRHVGRKTFMIYNSSSANSADLNLQGKIAPDSVATTFASDSTTGASLALAAGDIQILDVSKVYAEMRLRARDTIAGSNATLECSYLGKAGIGQ